MCDNTAVQIVSSGVTLALTPVIMPTLTPTHVRNVTENIIPEFTEIIQNFRSTAEGTHISCFALYDYTCAKKKINVKESLVCTGRVSVAVGWSTTGPLSVLDKPTRI